MYKDNRSAGTDTIWGFNAALNGSSLEDANRMEDRNQALIIANGIT